MLQNNKINLIISIVIAIAVWAFVVLIVNPVSAQNVDNVSVTLTNLDLLADEGLTVSTEKSQTVKVVVSGSRSDLIDLKADSFTATADVKGFPLGASSAPVTVKAPDGIEIVDVRPSQIDIIVEELVSVVKPVEINYSGKLPKNTEPGFVILAPQEIEVSGTKDAVDSVVYLRANVDVAELSDSEKTLNIEVLPMAADSESVYNVTLSQDRVYVTATLCKLKEVSLEIATTGKLANDHIMTNLDVPSTVFIRGTSKEFDSIKEITANDINVEGMSDTTIIYPELNLPPDVELANNSTNLMVTVEVDNIKAKSFMFSSKEIELLGLNSNYSAHVNTSGITVTIFGTEDELNNISETDIVPYADLSALNLSAVDPSAETSEVELQLECSKSHHRITSDHEFIRITVVKINTP